MELPLARVDPLRAASRQEVGQSEAVLRMLGACRLPDLTTSGDFLRRFDDAANPGSLDALRTAVDEIQDRAWKKIKKRRGRRRCREAWIRVDVDGHWEATTGVQKEADFDRKGRWGICRSPSP